MLTEKYSSEGLSEWISSIRRSLFTSEASSIRLCEIWAKVIASGRGEALGVEGSVRR
jgi:hypothetical protein